VVAAFRWAPRHRWLILTQGSLDWPSRVAETLLRGAGAGRWAVVAGEGAVPGGLPSAGLYDPPMGGLFERALRRGERVPARVLAAAEHRVYRVGEPPPVRVYAFFLMSNL